jgi:glucan 1,3-beta-glucosidase
MSEWNLDSSPANPSGMWDVHTRIGGFGGSNLLYADCAATTNPVTAVDRDCIAAFMSLHLSKTSQGLYLENVWLWVADHDIEDSGLRRVTVYAGRGLYSESTKGNFWLVGTSSEHHVLYQYQFANTSNVFMGQIQTETAYFQPNPKARTPFSVLTAWNDPNFQVTCNGQGTNCEAGWALRIIDSQNIFTYGAGMYSFFNNYSTGMSSTPSSE